MMRKISLLLFFLSLMPLSMSAQGVAGMFVSLPDSMITYLEKGLRNELIDDVKQKETPVVVNSIGDSTIVDVLTDDYMRLQCNDARTIEMKLLPRKAENDTVLCVVNTFNGPASESELAVYSLDWKKIDGDFVPKVDASDLLAKPDSMTDEKFIQLTDFIDPLLIKMNLSADDNTLTVSISLPAIASDKEKDIKGLLLQRKFKWNGGKFN